MACLTSKAGAHTTTLAQRTEQLSKLRIRVHCCGCALDSTVWRSQRSSAPLHTPKNLK